jgi:demethoxyubiquinone hydroxylase (CLK1/Coq7/Cat5 family)
MHEELKAEPAKPSGDIVDVAVGTARYQEQVASLEGKPQLTALRNQLEAFRRDEVRHGEDAGSRYDAP